MRMAVTAMTFAAGIGAMLAGWFLIAGNLPFAFALVIIAMVLDMLDGPLARRFGVTSRLGAWLDSFADVFVYLLFPALYWYYAYNIPLPVLALFVGAGCFRLVRFAWKGLEEQEGKLYYGGMPVYYDQVLLALSLAIPFDGLLLTALVIVVSALAISTIPFAKLPVRVLSSGIAVYVAIVIFKVFYAS